MYWWYMIKNTDTQLAFVCSADPVIYSSIVSDLKNLQLLPIDDESWREVKFLSYVKIILSKLADNLRRIYFAQLGT